MKHINKNKHSHPDIQKFENLFSKTWNELHSNYSHIYDNLVNILKNEQNYKCGYCETILKEQKDCYHVEHIKPKSGYPQEMFCYNNVILSCGHNYPNTQESKHPHCGARKKAQYSQDFISPLVNDCADFFCYKQDGTLSNNPAKEPTKGDYTIQVLALNSPSLVKKRKKAYRVTIGYVLERENNKEQDPKLKDIEKQLLSQDCEYHTFLLKILRDLLY